MLSLFNRKVDLPCHWSVKLTNLLKLIVAVLVVAIALVACSVDTVITEDFEQFEWRLEEGTYKIHHFEQLQDGAFRIWQLEGGVYELQMTSSGDGASVEWIGPSCAGTSQTNSYSATCEFTGPGQLKLQNPTGLGLGSTSSITVEITKLDS